MKHLQIFEAYQDHQQLQRRRAAAESVYNKLSEQEEEQRETLGAWLLEAFKVLTHVDVEDPKLKWQDASLDINPEFEYTKLDGKKYKIVGVLYQGGFYYLELDNNWGPHIRITFRDADLEDLAALQDAINAAYPDYGEGQEMGFFMHESVSTVHDELVKKQNFYVKEGRYHDFYQERGGRKKIQQQIKELEAEISRLRSEEIDCEGEYERQMEGHYNLLGDIIHQYGKKITSREWKLDYDATHEPLLCVRRDEGDWYVYYANSKNQILTSDVGKTLDLLAEKYPEFFEGSEMGFFVKNENQYMKKPRHPYWSKGQKIRV